MNFDQFSLCVVPLKLFCGGHQLGTATGFFWLYRERVFLVSNWHVFSGRNPHTGQPIDRDCAVPDEVSFAHAHMRTSEIVEVRTEMLREDGSAAWIQHSVLGQEADVAALDVTEVLGDGLTVTIKGREQVVCVNTIPQIDNAMLKVTNDLYILGFPFGMQPTSVLPIWKRASVASEPDYPVNGHPCFYVDTATRKGMSGSPVLLRTRHYQLKTEPQSQAFHSRTPAVTQFVGVYSGRNVGHEHEAQLGLIWRREVLDQILAESVPGNFTLRPSRP